MERENLEYLRDVVIPFVATMPTWEEWLAPDSDLPSDSAVLNFGDFQDHHRATDKPISGAFECGLEGCLAGWYRWLAIRDRRIEDWEVADFNYNDLGEHFGISDEQAMLLFSSSGAGIEFARDTKPPATRAVLAARARYLDKLLAA